MDLASIILTIAACIGGLIALVFTAWAIVARIALKNFKSAVNDFRL